MECEIRKKAIIQCVVYNHYLYYQYQTGDANCFLKYVLVSIYMTVFLFWKIQNVSRHSISIQVAELLRIRTHEIIQCLKFDVMFSLFSLSN